MSEPQRFDPDRVAAVLRGYRARLNAQRIVADELADLADEARREAFRQESDYNERVEAWRGHGVSIPEDMDEAW